MLADLTDLHGGTDSNLGLGQAFGSREARERDKTDAHTCATGSQQVLYSYCSSQMQRTG